MTGLRVEFRRLQFLFGITLTIALLLAQNAVGQASYTSQVRGTVTDQTGVHEFRPKTDDVCFKDLNWLPTFWDGVMTAQKEDKPILLWAMNGHPMACT